MNSNRSRLLPSIRKTLNSKNILFDDIRSFIEEHDVRFLKVAEQTNGKNFLDYYLNLIWYLDSHWEMFKSAVGMKMPDSQIVKCMKNDLTMVIPQT